jgi:D-serine deaminase-like pyridoxal phosphate-dependent protein
MTNHLTRRGFLRRSASAGALGLVASRVAAAPLDEASAAAMNFQSPSAGKIPASDDSMVPPAYRGFLKKNLHDLPTPALLIDLDVFEKNIKTLADYMKDKKATFRPHGKAHKSSAIGKIQLAYGARGICAAKLGEADPLVHGGIKDVLITAPVVGTLKIKRLMDLLAISPDVKAVVDNEQNAIDLSTAALAAKRKLKVAIDVNVGQNRTGVEPADAEKLAQVVAKQKGLELIGLQGYGGNNQHTNGFDARKTREMASNEKVLTARQGLEKSGFDVSMVSVGGTGTYNIDAEVPGITEIQPGSFIFMDSHYNKIGGKDQQPAYSDFGNSLIVLATVISRPATGNRVVVDAGVKALSTDESVPEVLDVTGVTYGGSGDEYGSIRWQNAPPSRDLKVGDQVLITPGHCDTTVNLYNVFFGVRKGVVEHVWTIEGRGRSD